MVWIILYAAGFADVYSCPVAYAIEMARQYSVACKRMALVLCNIVGHHSQMCRTVVTVFFCNYVYEKMYLMLLFAN